MCFGGSESTNNVHAPGYAATPEDGATAVQRDSVLSPPSTNTVPGLADRPTQADFTAAPRTATGTGLNVRGMN